MTVARWLIGSVGVMGLGGLLADYLIWPTARQHMKNPAWPPHAKFHNAQTMLLGIGLGILSLVLVMISTVDSFPLAARGGYSVALLVEHAPCSCISGHGMGRPGIS